MSEPFKVPQRGWSQKFSDAFRGLSVAVRENNSFRVHFSFTIAVFALAAWLAVEPWRWTVLILCIMTMLGTETLNTALEELAHAVEPQFNPKIRDALDVGSAAVLIAAMGSTAIGLITLLPPMISRCQTLLF